jgi:hypothetical protein
MTIVVDWIDTVTARGVRVSPGFRKIAKHRQKLPSKMEARYGCNDCSVNVLKAGEFYMLDPDIWEQQLSLGWNDNLCIGCLEDRLGRKIGLRDIVCFPDYAWMYPTSPRLLDRYGFIKGKNGKWRRKTKRDRDAEAAKEAV